MHPGSWAEAGQRGGAADQKRGALVHQNLSPHTLRNGRLSQAIWVGIYVHLAGLSMKRWTLYLLLCRDCASIHQIYGHQSPQRRTPPPPLSNAPKACRSWVEGQSFGVGSSRSSCQRHLAINRPAPLRWSSPSKRVAKRYDTMSGQVRGRPPLHLPSTERPG